MTQIYKRFADLFDTIRAGAAAIIGGFLVVCLGVVKFLWPGVMKL
jgi:hypothetical protein